MAIERLRKFVLLPCYEN